MGLKEPAVAYVANNSAEAQVIVTALRGAGLEAVVEPNLHALGEFPLGGVFRSRVLVTVEDVELAQRIIQEQNTLVKRDEHP